MFFDAPSSPVVVTERSTVKFTVCGGGNNAGFGCTVSRNSCIQVASSGANMGLTGASGDFAFGPNSTAFAFDVTATPPAYIATGRTLSWANLVAAVASGGFGGAINDPVTSCEAGIDP